MTGIIWSTPPSVLIKNIDEYEKKVMIALQAVAVRWGQQTQDFARSHAPWQDRTGNARSGLFFAVDGFGLGPIIGEINPAALDFKTDVEITEGDDQTLVIVISHTVFYGKYLETLRGGKWAIVMSSIEANLNSLERMVKDLLK
jgi:hypothetical protein